MNDMDPQQQEMLYTGMPGIADREGNSVPTGLPTVIDAHVHVFPDNLFSAVRQWFDHHAWPIRYRHDTSAVLNFLLERGVRHIIALQYAHKPGLAAQLNDYLAEKCRQYPGRVTGMATVFPGEENAGAVLEQAFSAGLGGLKLHAHVQCFDMSAAYMEPLYDCCQRHNKPIIMHVGREPKSLAYSCDPYRLCAAAKLEEVLRSYPALRVCVPHMGFDELSAYRKLLERYDNLWLDTTMVLADYLPLSGSIDLMQYRCDRVMYGSDFPNIPYAWDRELKALQAAALPAEALERITWKNATNFYTLSC